MVGAQVRFCFKKKKNKIKKNKIKKNKKWWVRRFDFVLKKGKIK
jgi:hypothetical protein